MSLHLVQERLDPFSHPTDAQRRSLTIDTVDLYGGVRLVVSGEIDIATAPDFRAQVWAAVNGADVTEINMGGVEFIDSTGLHALIDIRAAAKRDTRIVITDPSRIVTRLFEVTGMSETFGLPTGRSGT